MGSDENVAKKKIGRPTVFTPDKQASLLDYISNGGLMLEWCRNRKMSPSVVFKFMNTEEGESFRAAFLRAREDCAHVYMDQTIKIADEVGTKKRPIDPQRQKLRVDTRMRIAGFLNRKSYGTRPGDGEDLNRMTLGDLVDAAIRHGAAQLAQREAKPGDAALDITPPRDGVPSDRALAQLNAPHTEQPAAKRSRRAAT